MARRIAAILGLLFATTAAHAQTEVLVPASPPDSAEEATTMPEYCSELHLNCVLSDGPPRPVVFGAFEPTVPSTATPPTSATPAGAAIGATGATGGMTSGSAAGGFAGR